MFDVLLLNSAKGLQKKTLELHGVYPEDYVYTKYSIDSLQFALSNNYYAYDVESYKKIKPCLLLYFNTEPVTRPIREHRFKEYELILSKQ